MARRLQPAAVIVPIHNMQSLNLRNLQGGSATGLTYRAKNWWYVMPKCSAMFDASCVVNHTCAQGSSATTISFDGPKRRKSRANGCETPATTHL